MRFLLRVFFSLFSLLLVFVSCDEDKKELSEVAILVTPGSTEVVTAESGDKVRYKLEFYTTNSYVQRFVVESFDSYNGKAVQIDSTCNSARFDYDFVFTAPASNRDSLNVELSFQAWDNDGNKCEITRTLTVFNKLVLVEEKSGIVLWGASSGLPDALSFDDPSKTFVWENSSDSLNADMYVEADEDFANVSLKSKTSARFVRINSFDYAAATASTISAVFSGSRHDESIEDLRVNDIVLVGHNNEAAGVLRVANILRTGTSDERCVQLAFKGLTK